MSVADLNPPSTNEPPRSYRDAMNLLKLAEDLLQFVEKHEQKIQWNLALIVVGLASVAMLWLIISTGDVVLKTCLSIGIVLHIAFFVHGIWSTAKVSRRDRRALHRVVDLLREVEKAVAEQNGVSDLERLELRIRLARFGIGPGHAV